MDTKEEDKLKEKLRTRGHSAVVVNRLFRMANEFVTPDAFFTATKNAVAGVASKLWPDAKHGLGDKLYRCFDDAAWLWRHPEETAGTESRRPAPAAAAGTDLMFTRSQLKDVVDFMEYFGRESISAAEMLSVTVLARGGTRAQKETAE